MAPTKERPATKTIATNREARHEYFVLEALETGVELKGTEVKSLRAGGVNLKDSWVDIEVTRQLFRRSLHRMAQPDLFDMRIAGIHRPGIHRHWVNIVEHGGIGADFRHVLANLPQMRNGT